MASTQLGDIPGARHDLPPVAVAAVASNGAAANIGIVGPFEHPVRIRNLYYVPTAADQGTAASYRRITAQNIGTGAAGTGVVGSVNLSVSKASLTPSAFTVDSTVTLAAGEVLLLKQTTVLGTDATGTVLQAGTITGSYEVI